MQIVNLLANSIGALLAADTTYLANAAAMKVSLIIQPFSPSIDRILSDLTLNAAAPLAAVAGVAGAQIAGIDPLTGFIIVEVKPPAGGFRWNTGVAFAAPCTVFGFALTNNGITTLLGTENQVPNINLSGDNQELVAPSLRFIIDPSKIF